MKTIIKKIVKVFTPNRPTGYYYQEQFMTDELERELMKAYCGTGFRGKRR